MYAEASTVIGLTGNKGSGKSTFANAISSVERNAQYYSTGDIVTEVANKWLSTLKSKELLDEVKQYKTIPAINDWIETLPKSIFDATGKKVDATDLFIDRDDIDVGLADKIVTYVNKLAVEPKLLERTITNENKKHHREILEWLGKYLKEKIDVNIWINVLDEKAWQSMQLGRTVILIDGLRFSEDELVTRRLGAKIVRVIRPGFESDGGHTELSEAEVKEDIRIHNDSSKENLGRLAISLFNALRFNEIRSHSKAPEEYYASDFDYVIAESSIA